jgi:hypothetical protein
MAGRTLSGATIALIKTNQVNWYAFVVVTLPTGTQRFTNMPGGAAGSVALNIDGSGVQTWTEADLILGGIDQGSIDSLSVSFLNFANIDNTWSVWANTVWGDGTVGLRWKAVQVWIGILKADGTLQEAYEAYVGLFDNQRILQRAELSLVPHVPPWTRDDPYLTVYDLGMKDLMPDPTKPIYWGGNDTASG